MSLDANKVLVRRYFEEGWNQGNQEVADAILSPGFALHNPNLPQPVRGIEGLKQVITRFRAAFPDLYVAIGQLIAEGDTVMARTTARGTHRGQFQHIAPTGKAIAYSSIGIFRVVGGRIEEVYVINDTLGLLQQLGAVS
jgi:steroid delta-isomerase-like uncharacterized protein